MKSAVLFSPVGKTDPVRGSFDGPMLHIIRHYKPELAVLFMTAEIERDERAYGWYSGFVKAVSPKTQIDMICSGIEDPSEFGNFIPRFEAEIRALAQAYPEHTILLNMSSGTPQMSAALCVLASALPFNFCPIQVKSPENRANDRLAHTEPGTSIREHLDNLMDHDPDLHTDNRCVQVNLDNYVRRQIKENLRAQIKAGAYNAAYITAQNNMAYLDAMLLSAVEGAYLRKDYQFKAAHKIFSANFPDALKEIFPLVALPETNVLEYYLGMRNDYQQEDYARFFVRLSPFTEALARYVLKARCGFDCARCAVTHKNSNGTLQEKLKVDKLRDYRPEVLLSVERGMTSPLRDDFINLYVLCQILAYYKDRDPEIERLYQGFEKLRDCQQKRNQAAHVMTAITAQDVRRATGMEVRAFAKWLDDFFLDAMKGSAIRPQMLDNYQAMNELILKML